MLLGLSLNCELASVIGDRGARHYRRECAVFEALRMGIGSAQVACACQTLVDLEWIHPGCRTMDPDSVGCTGSGPPLAEKNE